jgi:hypothetical protein
MTAESGRLKRGLIRIISKNEENFGIGGDGGFFTVIGCVTLFVADAIDYVLEASQE